MIAPEDAEHLRSKIEAAALRLEPFPYVIVRDLLPQALYDAALRAWPTNESFAPRNYMLRRQFNLATQSGQLPPETRAVWQSMLNVAEIVNRALYRKFTPYFARKFLPLFGSGWREIVAPYTTSFRQAQLAQYSGEAGLHPHVDSVRLVVNSFLYASDTPEPDVALGTVLYRSFGFMTSDNNLNISDKMQRRVLAPAVVVPYRPNCMLSFLNTPFAFHGVEDFNIGERQRRLILFSPTLNQSVEEIEGDFHKGALKVED